MIESSQVVDPKRLKEGGKIAIIPFAAGADVEANEELDKIALMIIRGVSETLSDAHENLKVVFDEDAKTADFILEGHVTALTAPGTLDRWVMGNRKMELSVKGKLVDQKTQQLVAVFTDHKKSQNKGEDFRQLGFKIGQDIANFLLNGL